MSPTSAEPGPLEQAVNLVTGAADLGLRWLYTGDPHASDEAYHAALEAAGAYYTQNAAKTHQRLDILSDVDPTGLSDLTAQGVTYVEGEELHAEVMEHADEGLESISELTDAVGQIRDLADAARGVRNALRPQRHLGATPAGEPFSRSADRTQGWRVGDPIENLTSKGNVPSWDAVRQRFWKNVAHYNSGNYSAAELARMQQGLAPQRMNPDTGLLESKELHHAPPRRKGGLFDVVPTWPDDHAAIDPFRRTAK